MAEGKWRNWFNYAETREVRVHSCWLFWIYWIGITGVVLGILVFMVWYSRGWHEKDSVEGAVTTKLHGLTFNRRIWDNADYMIPPKENGAFTVITSLLQTNQTQSTCPEDPSIPDGRCTQDSDCIKDQPVFRGNGFKTGRCVNFAPGDNRTVCEIYAWCPVEIDDPSNRYAIADENFVVEIKNFVRFPDFQINKQNFLDDMSKEELNNCTYDEDHHRNRYCPVFRVATMVEKASYTMDSMVMEGGKIQMVIKWECTFGSTRHLYKKECFPTYRFQRLDVSKNNFTRGFHLRYADQYLGNDGRIARTLLRAYGIRVIVTVIGTGWQFNWGRFILTLGSGIAYLSAVSFFVSKVFIKCHRICGCCTPCWEESDEDHRPINPDATVQNDTRDRQVRRTMDDAIAIDFITQNSFQDYLRRRRQRREQNGDATCGQTCSQCLRWCCCRCDCPCSQAEETPQAASPPQTGHGNPAMSRSDGGSCVTYFQVVPTAQTSTQPTTGGDDGEVEQRVKTPPPRTL